MEISIRIKAGDPSFLVPLGSLQNVESREVLYNVLYETLSNDPSAMVVITSDDSNNTQAFDSSIELLKLSSVLQTLSGDLSRTVPVPMSMHVFACISSMCCSLISEHSKYVVESRVQRALQERSGFYFLKMLDCFQQVIIIMSSVNISNVSNVSTLERLKECLFVLKWQALPELIGSILPRLLSTLSSLAHIFRGLSAEHMQRQEVVEMEVYLWDTVTVLLCQCDDNIVVLDPAIVDLWQEHLRDTWGSIGFAALLKLSATSTSYVVSPINYSMMRLLDKFLECKVFAQSSLEPPENAWSPKVFYDQMCSVAVAAASVDVSKSELVYFGFWWRCLVGFCSFKQFHERCAFNVPKEGSRQATLPTFLALQALLKDEPTYFRCCVTLARVVVGRSAVHRREFCQSLTKSASPRLWHINMLCRALQPWLVSSVGVKLRRWTPTASKYIGVTLSTLLGAAWPNVDSILKIHLGSSKWTISDITVDLGKALDALLVPVLHIQREHPEQEDIAQDIQERVLCGVQCTVAMLEGASGLLSIPKKSFNGLSHSSASTANNTENNLKSDNVGERTKYVDLGLHPDTWSDAARVASIAVEEGGLFAQRAAEPRDGVTLPSMDESGALLRTLAFLELAFVAIGSAGKVEEPSVTVHNYLYSFYGYGHTKCSNATCSGKSSGSDKGYTLDIDTHVDLPIQQRRASALCALVRSWQSLLNAIGRSIVTLSALPPSSLSASSQAPSQMAFTCEAGASQVPGTRHRVCATEDDVLQTALHSIFSVHVTVWTNCWAPLLNSPRSIVRAREGYLEALWWLIHRLSAFNVIQESSLTKRVYLAMVSSSALLPNVLTGSSHDPLCALWVVLLPSIVHARALQNDLLTISLNRLLYAISRCQRALLQASPPVLEEIIDWIPNMLASLSYNIKGISQMQLQTDKKDSVHSRVHIRSLVHDDRACAMLLGTLWQTVVFSLTQELDMSSFWGWSQLDALVLNATPFDSAQSTTEVAAMSIRKTLTAPLALLRSGQASMCLWMHSFPYIPEGSVKSPRECWQRLCQTWLPYEYLLAKHATESDLKSVGNEHSLLYKQSHYGFDFKCGGVYAGEERCSILSSKEILTVFDLLDSIARTLHDSPVELPQLLLLTWRHFLLDHLVALFTGFCETCRDVLSDEVPLEPQLLESTSSFPGLKEIIGSLLKPHWKELLIVGVDEDAIVIAEESSFSSFSFASSEVTPLPRIRIAGGVDASAHTLSPTPSSGTTLIAQVPEMLSTTNEVRHTSALVAITELFVNIVRHSFDACSNVMQEKRQSTRYISTSQLLRYVCLLLCETKHMVNVLCVMRSETSINVAGDIMRLLSELDVSMASIGALGMNLTLNLQRNEVIKEDVRALLELARSVRDVCKKENVHSPYVSTLASSSSELYGVRDVASVPLDAISTKLHMSEDFDTSGKRKRESELDAIEEVENEDGLDQEGTSQGTLIDE